MVVLNGVSRYHLAMLAMEFAPRVQKLTSPLRQECQDQLAKHHIYVQANLQDMPEVQNWVWTNRYMFAHVY